MKRLKRVYIDLDADYRTAAVSTKRADSDGVRRRYVLLDNKSDVTTKLLIDEFDIYDFETEEDIEVLNSEHEYIPRELPPYAYYEEAKAAKKKTYVDLDGGVRMAYVSLEKREESKLLTNYVFLENKSDLIKKLMSDSFDVYDLDTAESFEGAYWAGVHILLDRVLFDPLSEPRKPVPYFHKILRYASINFTQTRKLLLDK